MVGPTPSHWISAALAAWERPTREENPDQCVETFLHIVMREARRGRTRQLSIPQEIRELRSKANCSAPC